MKYFRLDPERSDDDSDHSPVHGWNAAVLLSILVSSALLAVLGAFLAFRWL